MFPVFRYRTGRTTKLLEGSLTSLTVSVTNELPSVAEISKVSVTSHGATMFSLPSKFSGMRSHVML